MCLVFGFMVFWIREIERPVSKQITAIHFFYDNQPQKWFKCNKTQRKTVEMRCGSEKKYIRRSKKKRKKEKNIRNNSKWDYSNKKNKCEKFCWCLNWGTFRMDAKSVAFGCHFHEMLIISKPKTVNWPANTRGGHIL